jgi:hypothetical protein
MGARVNPTDTNTDVVILSAFGRGNWLAAELAAKSFSVQMIDVTHTMGRWAPEDWEGPFGFWQDEKLLSSQVERLTNEDYQVELADGFAVWPPSGPIDMRGPLTGHWLDSKPGMAAVKNYVQSATEGPVEDLGYANTWLAHLAQQLAGTVYRPNAMALSSGLPLPIWAPYFVRRVTRRGLEKSLDWCRSKGVDVITGSQAVDLAIEGKRIIGLQVQGEQTKVLKGHQFVLCLSSLEAQFHSSTLAKRLFARGPLQPEWCWMRWRVKGHTGIYREVMPMSFVMIGDMGLPWTHGNLLIVRACEIDGQFDVWARLPAHHRFQRSYAEEFGTEIVERLNSRIPEFAAELQDQPQDYHYDIGQLGPSLFPVFDASTRAAWQPLKLQNLAYDGVEWLENLDWNGRFWRQNEILQDLTHWHQVRTAKLERGADRDRAIHPS